MVDPPAPGPALADRLGRFTLPVMKRPKAHFILLGGFLGAGKTSAIARLAPYLSDQGLRVVVITNDQGERLVDTAALRARSLQTSEVTGGCFCCRFDVLLDQCRFRGAEGPDVYVAEAVGSCADLAATVAAPLARLHGDRFTVAPLSVLIDPAQARSMLGLESRRTFSPAVRYLYLKQLEEADFLVLNKSETLAPAAMEALRAALAARFPQAEVFSVSVQAGAHLEAWFSRILLDERRPRPPIELDYDLYAAGEASLAWFDAASFLERGEPFNSDRMLLAFADEVRAELRRRGNRLAHLKISLAAPGAADHSDLTLVQVIAELQPPQLSQSLGRAVTGGELTINLRAEADPQDLPEMIWAALEKSAPPGLRQKPSFQQCFRPARPQPTHPRS